MQLKTGDSSIITSTDGCGSIRQEISMKNTSSSSICSESDFDTRPTAKKICFTNGLVFEVIDYKTLRITANSLQHLGTYELWVWSYHVDNTGTKLWSIRATPMTVIITGQVINSTILTPVPQQSNAQKCSLEALGQNEIAITHLLNETGISKSIHNLEGKI